MVTANKASTRYLNQIPTVALELFVPQRPEGAIIAFDEFNINQFPEGDAGSQETQGLPNLRFKRFPFASSLSDAVIE